MVLGASGLVSFWLSPPAMHRLVTSAIGVTCDALRQRAHQLITYPIFLPHPQQPHGYASCLPVVSHLPAPFGLSCTGCTCRGWCCAGILARALCSPEKDVCVSKSAMKSMNGIKQGNILLPKMPTLTLVVNQLGCFSVTSTAEFFFPLDTTPPMSLPPRRPTDAEVCALFFLISARL